MGEVFFIDLDGNEIQFSAINSHIGLSAKLISENEDLKKQFIESGYKRPDLFLINEIGYISVSIDSIFGTRIVANSEKITDAQMKSIRGYLIEGGKIDYIDPTPDDFQFEGRHKPHTK